MRTKLKIINQSGIANFDFLVQISDTWTASTDSLISYKIIYTTDSFTQITPSISFLLEVKKALLVRSISYSLEKYFSSQLWWDLALNDEKSLGCWMLLIRGSNQAQLNGWGSKTSYLLLIYNCNILLHSQIFITNYL